jgi:hypothetical protein
MEVFYMSEEIKQVQNAEVHIINVNVDELIDKAVEKAFSAGRNLEKIESRKKRNPFMEETEKRLYAYPDLQLKVEKTKADIEDLKKEIDDYEKTGEAQGRSKDIVCASSSGGQRLTYQEKHEAIIQDKQLSLERTKKEIKEIDDTIEILSYQDKNKQVIEPWIDTVKLKYFECMRDDEIAELLHCDKTTVWRNRSRILSRLMTLWYGADALSKSS